MISSRSLLLTLAVAAFGEIAVRARSKPVTRSSQTALASGSEPDPSFAVSVELGGTAYVNKVSLVFHLLWLLVQWICRVGWSCACGTEN